MAGALTIVLLTSAPVSRAGAAPIATGQRPHQPVHLGSGPLLGVFEVGAPENWSKASQFAAATGLRPRVVTYYSPWGVPFSAASAPAAWRHSAYAFVHIEPAGVRLKDITSGRWDGYLRSYARAVRSFAHPVLLCFGHEMNGHWYSWGSGHETPAAFVAAWRHVVSVFRASGASNVTWVWTVNNIVGTGSPGLWWPGAAWVDWVGIDGYYYSADATFGSVFGSTIRKIRAFTSVPILIAETAVGVNPNRERQIRALFAGARAAHLVGVVWYDQAQHHGKFHQDWRLEDDGLARAAFATAARAYLK